MADVNVENLTNVEDDTPAPQPADPVVEQPAQALAPPPAQEPEPDDDTTTVPLSALKAVRLENKTLKERASQADTYAQQVAQLQGQLQGYQQVTEQLKRAPAVPAPTAPVVDQTAVEFARGLDLYRQNEHGQAVPDTDKAQQILGIMRNMANAEIAKAVKPMREQSAQERSAANYQWALQQKMPNGQSVDPKIVTDMWRSFPADYTANPNIAHTLVLTAIGAQAMQQPGTTAPKPGQPIHTEGVGGMPRPRPALSQIEQNVAKERGVDANKWADLTKGFQPGRANVLED